MSECPKRWPNHKFTVEERIELIKIVYSGNSLKKTVQIFAERHPDCEHTPTPSGITRLVKKFESTGSVLDKPIPGRPKGDEPWNRETRVKAKVDVDDPSASGACDWPGCGYVSNKKCLARHRLVHSTERNYPCDWPQCGKRFKSAVSLKNHLRIHYGDKRYACSWPGCKYRCVDSGNIRKHKRIHERQFERLLKTSDLRNSSDIKIEITSDENSL